MILKNDCYYLGTIVKKYSYKGEVLLKLDTDQPDLYESLESVLLEIRANLVPFFITKAQLHKSELLRVQFEGVNHESEAEQLIGTQAYLPLESLPKLSDDQFYFHEITNFQVIDKKHHLIGTIKEVIDQTSQPILKIINENNKEILIPLVDQIFTKIDKKNKEILIEAPEGLIELYLNL